MKKYRTEISAVVGGLILVAGIFLINSEAKTLTEQSTQPSVVKAVAPGFIPFVFGKSGSMSTVVEVSIRPDGKVDEAHIVEFSLFRDKSFEETAKKWVFAAAADAKQVRTARLTFVLRIMPKGTKWDELTTIFTPPYQVEVRHEIFEPHVYSDPNPVKQTDQIGDVLNERGHRRSGVIGDRGQACDLRFCDSFASRIIRMQTST